MLKLEKENKIEHKIDITKMCVYAHMYMYMQNEKRDEKSDSSVNYKFKETAKLWVDA